ncbi:hypothetical protein AAG570_005409 [Ranatra chinensis]|uniref:Uncharacterized protein n=1 Tax=Ranatra chinensis TaxID=642074 RepID=A0ABD0Y1W8_9HEMI
MSSLSSLFHSVAYGLFWLPGVEGEGYMQGYAEDYCLDRSRMGIQSGYSIAEGLSAPVLQSDDKRNLVLKMVCHADEGGKEEEEEEDEDGEGTGEDNAGCSSSDTDRHVPQPHVKQSRCCKKKRDGSNRYRLVTLQNLYGHPEGRAPTHFVVDGPPGGTASFAVDEGQDDSSSRQSTLDRRLVDVALPQGTNYSL